MIFLIEYDSANQSLVLFEKFKDSDNDMAEKKRLNLELDLFRKNIQHEVVLLQASSEALLRTTHRRYFQTLREISNEMINVLKSKS